MARAWYSFNGGTNTTLVSNYSLMTVIPTCINGAVICAIYAPEGGANPTGPLSANLQRYISNAVGTGLAQPQAPVNAKKYVYLKTTTP
jgi:hypothetical protein